MKKDGLRNIFVIVITQFIDTSIFLYTNFFNRLCQAYGMNFTKI